MLFLTKKDILENDDHLDLYQNGFNYNKINNIDYDLLEDHLKPYFYL
jgi:hypothetical protein